MGWIMSGGGCRETNNGYLSMRIVFLDTKRRHDIVDKKAGLKMMMASMGNISNDGSQGHTFETFETRKKILTQNIPLNLLHGRSIYRP